MLAAGTWFEYSSGGVGGGDEVSWGWEKVGRLVERRRSSAWRAV